MCSYTHLSIGFSIRLVCPFSVPLFFVPNYVLCDDDTIAVQFTGKKDTPTAHPFVFACLHTLTKTQLKIYDKEKGGSAKPW